MNDQTNVGTGTVRAREDVMQMLSVGDGDGGGSDAFAAVRGIACVRLSGMGACDRSDGFGELLHR